MSSETALSVDNLRKAYGETIAVDDVSFVVRTGEIFGMVGPNGAGKTTIIECIEGLRRPDVGEIRVLGLDPTRDGKALSALIGVQLQQSALPDRMKVWETLDLYASLYGSAADWNELLIRMGLEEKRNTPFSKLSGGQKQRLFVALSLINRPKLVFMDELTTGMDPQARRSMWDLVREIRDAGATIFLTTHFMEEAERLCDRVAIMDRGKIIALNTPENLIRGFGSESRVVFVAENGFGDESLVGLPNVTRVDRIGERVVVHGSGQRLVADVVGRLADAGVPFRDLHTEQPNLEDVFLTLTGRSIRN